MITIITDDMNLPATSSFLVVFIIYFAIALTFYFFMSYAFFRMAKKRDVENAYLAFIPFVRYLVAGKVIRKVSYFGKITDKVGLITMITVITTVFFNLFFFIYNYYLIFCALGANQAVEIILTSTGSGIYLAGEELSALMAIHYPKALVVIANIFSVIASIFDFVYIFVIFTFWNGLFAKFKPGMSIMYTLIATIIAISTAAWIIPIEIGGLFAFIFRNRDDVKINIYANPYGGYGGYQGGYGSQDPYGRPSAPKSNEENPFGEFDNENSSSSNDDPFDLN